MEYNEKTFEKVAIPRIKKFYDLHQDVFFARAMDLKDLLQEMRIDLWQILLKYEMLPDEEIAKLTNKILSRKLVGEKRRGYKYMKTEDVIVEENNQEKVVKGHFSQFVNIDSVDESKLSDNHESKLMRAKTQVEAIKGLMKEDDFKLLQDIVMEGKTIYEVACERSNCKERSECNIVANPDVYLSERGSVGKPCYAKGCKQYSILYKDALAINRLKNKLLKKLKKVQKKM
jgi:hypothetical protein